MWHGMESIGWGWLGLGLLHMVVFWGLVILVFVAIVKWLSGGAGSFDDLRAIDILKKRYAKGELTREEFQEMKKELDVADSR